MVEVGAGGGATFCGCGAGLTGCRATGISLIRFGATTRAGCIGIGRGGTCGAAACGLAAGGLTAGATANGRIIQIRGLTTGSGACVGSGVCVGGGAGWACVESKSVQ